MGSEEEESWNKVAGVGRRAGAFKGTEEGRAGITRERGTGSWPGLWKALRDKEGGHGVEK